MLSGKNILQTDFEEKNNSCKEIPGGKNFSLNRNIFHGLKCWEKKSYIVKLSKSNARPLTIWGSAIKFACYNEFTRKIH